MKKYLLHMYTVNKNDKTMEVVELLDKDTCEVVKSFEYNVHSNNYDMSFYLDKVIPNNFGAKIDIVDEYELTEGSGHYYRYYALIFNPNEVEVHDSLRYLVKNWEELSNQDKINLSLDKYREELCK